MLGIKTLVLLMCDEAWTWQAAEEVAAWYEEQLPEARIICLPCRGAALSFLEKPDSAETGAIWEEISRLSAMSDFALVIINHEGCSHNDMADEDRRTREFFQVIAMREKLPVRCLEKSGIRWLALYNIEKNGEFLWPQEEGPRMSGKAWFLGRYF